VSLVVGDGSFQHDDDHWLEAAAASARPEGSPRPPLPDMSPAPGSGCFALAVDTQALALTARWAFWGKHGGEEEDDNDGGDDEQWLTVRNTEVESSLTVSLVARARRPLQQEREQHEQQEQEQGSLLLPRTQEEFWRRLCLESPTDIEQLGGLLQQELEEDALASFPHPGRRTLLGCLGLRGVLALLAWSNHDADLFFNLMWTLRAHLLLLLQRRRQEAGADDGAHDSQSLRTAALRTALRCLTNRLALGAKAWLYTRLMGMRFFYALGEPALALAFFLHDAQLAPFPTPLPQPALPATWSHAYGAAFGRAAEAYLVVRCLEALHGQEIDGGGRYDYPPVRRREVLERALGSAGLRDGKGRRRIARALKRCAL
jgi:hypothetical protein